MNQQPHDTSIQICARLYPSIYKQFQCTAQWCQNNCCHDWNITFSKKDYLKIRRTPKSPELEDLTRLALRRLPDDRRSVDKYGEFISQNSACPYQDQKGLCQLQLECGAETLPKVCRTFPRLSAYTAMGLEDSLTTGCEAVVELLWDQPQGLDFEMEPLPKDKWRVCPDTMANRVFPAMREAVIDILQARAFSLQKRMLILGVVMENARDTWDDFHLENWLARVQLFLSDPSLTESLEELAADPGFSLMENTRVALLLAAHDKDVKKALRGAGTVGIRAEDNEAYITIDHKYYEDRRQKFDEHFGNVEYFFENLMVNTAFIRQIPHVKSGDDLWKSYVGLCNLYSFFRFISVLMCGMEPSRDKLFRAIVAASRGLLHNSDRTNALQESFFKNNSATLAHMAVLLRGI